MKMLTDLQKLPDYHDHELVIEVLRPDVGLKAFVAIHNTTLGPAVGGTRMHFYKDDNEAITDALRLSHAMTYKCALAGVPFGGGKGVIVGDPKKIKNNKLLQSYAEAIENLHGIFFTGEDVGLQQEDVTFMQKHAQYFIGREELAGDPSPFAALSVFVSIQAACCVKFGNSNLKNKKIVIKGVGKVGSSVAELVANAGAQVFVSDIDEKTLKQVKQRTPSVQIINNNEAQRYGADIYVPCALGKEFTTANVGDLKTQIICGGANNQLATSEVGRMILKKNIIFVPDYVANAGGLIDVVDELDQAGYNKSRVLSTINNIGGLVLTILERSKLSNTPANIVADIMAEEVLAKAKNNNLRQ